MKESATARPGTARGPAENHLLGGFKPRKMVVYWGCNDNVMGYHMKNSKNNCGLMGM